MKKPVSLILSLAGPLLLSCGQAVPVPEQPDTGLRQLSLPGVARLLSELPLTREQVEEVHDAVTASAANGYDDEYMMCDLFASPGAGVGSDGSHTRAEAYARPLRELIRTRLSERLATRSGETDTQAVDAFITSLSASGMQIYWPYAEAWDGKTLPVITFDPESEASSNLGYELKADKDGTLTVEVLTAVDEKLARKRPVWVVNANDDSGYLTLEQLRRSDPEWGKGGRVIVGSAPSSAGTLPTRTGQDGNIRTLVLKEFKMKQHYDSWFRGASEFWCKCGSVQGFTASTEAELRLFSPTVTDFMISIKRDQLGVSVPFDAIVISDWTDQLDSFAFMIVEDDGGSQTSWKVEATVKVQSKSYGITINIPYNERDDIVWRGSLSSRYFENYAGKAIHFGGVDVIFEIL